VTVRPETEAVTFETIGRVVTCTVACAITDVTSFEAVSVYTVVEVGTTEHDPDGGIGEQFAGKGEIEAFVAFDTFQLRVADWPKMIEDGVAVKELIAGASGLVGMR
jgi:hypothetical protein